MAFSRQQVDFNKSSCKSQAGESNGVGSCFYYFFSICKVFPKTTSRVKVSCFCQSELSAHPKGSLNITSKKWILFMTDIYPAN